MSRAAVAATVLLIVAMGAQAQVATVEDGVTFATNGATVRIQTGNGIASNVTFNADGSVVLLNVTIDVRAPITPEAWNLTKLNSTTMLLQGNTTTNGTMRVAGFNGSYVVRGVANTPPFRVNGSNSTTWHVPAGAQTVNLTPWSGFAPYTTGTFATLGANRTVWANATVTLSTVSNDSVVANTYHKKWRDGETAPLTWNAGTSVQVDGSLVGEWTVQYYAVDALESAEETRQDKVVVGRTHTLVPGWNLLYLEGIREPKNVSEALAEVLGTNRTEAVWTHDATNGWRVYQASLPDDVRVNWSVNQSTPMFIKINGTTPVTVHDGYRVAPASGNVTLGLGWNVVQPLKWRDPTPASTVFANVTGINAVWKFNSTTQSWAFWNPANPLSSGTFNVDQTTPIIVYMSAPGRYSW